MGRLSGMSSSEIRDILVKPDWENNAGVAEIEQWGPYHYKWLSYNKKDWYDGWVGHDIGSWSEISDPVVVPGLGTVSMEASFGGEGQGDDYWFVLKIEDGDDTVYVRQDGWYASHVGGEYDGEFSKVDAKEKTILVYT